MKVEYSKRAVSDLDQIAAYYATSGEAAFGEKIATAIRERVARITETPLFGRPVTRRPGVRLILLVRYRYKIFLQACRDDGPDYSHPAYVAPPVAIELNDGGRFVAALVAMIASFLVSLRAKRSNLRQDKSQREGDSRCWNWNAPPI
jgi:toxin ParE1/3/4